MAKKKTPASGGRTNPRDAGVRWAQQQLRPIRSLFTTRQQREIVEMLQGTGDWSERERFTVFFQQIELITGDSFPRSASPRERLTMLRQEVELNRRGRNRK